MSAISIRPTTYADTKNEDIEDFVNIFENECEAFSWSTEQQKLAKNKIAFTGNALIRFNEKFRPKTDITTWAIMKENRLKSFNKTKPELRHRLIKRQYQGDHDLYDYCNFVTKTCKVLDTNQSDHTILLTVINGLPMTLKDFVNKSFSNKLKIENFYFISSSKATKNSLQFLSLAVEISGGRCIDVSTRYIDTFS